MRDRVQRLLEARVGFGNAVVEVSVDTVTESEAIRERTVDPDSRVAISTDTEERNSSSTDGGNGSVTVASNLPDEEGGDGENSSSQNTETRERVNFEVSEVEREIVRGPGAIKRLTVAVLVNDVEQVTEAGETTLIPRDESEIEALRELVASAVGFDEARGDEITIKSMALLNIAPQGTLVESSFLDELSLDLMSAIQMAILALVTLILGLFVVRPLLSKPATDTGLDIPALPVGDPSLSEFETGGDPASSEDFELPDLPMISSFGDEIDELPDLNIGSASNDDPVERLRGLIGERQDETVEILRSWLEDKEENV